MGILNLCFKYIRPGSALGNRISQFTRPVKTGAGFSLMGGRAGISSGGGTVRHCHVKCNSKRTANIHCSVAIGIYRENIFEIPGNFLAATHHLRCNRWISRQRAIAIRMSYALCINISNSDREKLHKLSIINIGLACVFCSNGEKRIIPAIIYVFSCMLHNYHLGMGEHNHTGFCAHIT